MTLAQISGFVGFSEQRPVGVTVAQDLAGQSCRKDDEQRVYNPNHGGVSFGLLGLEVHAYREKEAGR